MTPRYARWWGIGIWDAVRFLVTARSFREMKQAVRLLLCPIDLWRYHEFAAVLDAVGAPSRILDIGSPKVLAAIVPTVSRATVICADIARDALERPKRGRLPLQCDALHLPFADESLPCIFSVSAIEHIAGEGDRHAMAEIARVLAPGGIAIVTVPLVTEYAERWIESDPYGKQTRDSSGRVFFSHYYDWAALQERFAHTSKLRVVRMHAWQENRDGWYARYCRATQHAVSPRAIVTKLFDPYWAANRIESVPEGPSGLTRHGLAAIVFEKI